MLLYQTGLVARAESTPRQEVCPVAVAVGDEAGQADEGPHPATTPHPDNLLHAQRPIVWSPHMGEGWGGLQVLRGGEGPPD